jgi:hypothetical protein
VLASGNKETFTVVHRVEDLNDLAYQMVKKIFFAKANGATQAQASKYCAYKIDDDVWNSINPLTYEKSPKYKDGWIE